MITQGLHPNILFRLTEGDLHSVEWTPQVLYDSFLQLDWMLLDLFKQIDLGNQVLTENE